MIGLRAALALSILAAAGPVAAATSCQLAKVADLPVTMDGLRPIVTATINGKEARFLIDTGSFYSVLAQDAVEKYGLKTYPAPSTFSIVGVSGAPQSATVTKVAEFAYAGIPIRQLSFLVSGAGYGQGIVGVIGQNLLGAVDVEYDLANGVIRLFQAKDCQDSILAYWSAGKPLSIVPTDQQTAKQPHIVIGARINGHPVKVTLDTGATTSVLRRDAAKRSDVDMSANNLKPAGYSTGFGGGRIENSIGALQSFGIGDEEIRNTRIRIADVELAGTAMLVGTDFFLSHRVMVARSQRKLYFTYNGGPVFRLDKPANVEDDSPAATQSVASGEGTVTADELDRRGAAAAARNDFKAALADLTRAIALEPKVGLHYYHRARIRDRAGQKTQALADMDQALVLWPTDREMLLMRADLRLAAKDINGAQSDFTAAMKLTPEDKELPLQVASAYSDAHLHEASVRLYDAWIAAHAGDPLMGHALNSRCWARALAGTELPKALADCDAARALGDRGAGTRDSRGLVLLRLGRFEEAIAQYNTALRLQPKVAWSLYGRGVAKLKTGRIAEGKADLEAAVALQPDIGEEAKGFGVTPD
jgi:tetratricopeptide (TPR) repeat protein/predicted aspartyl protease